MVQSMHHSSQHVGGIPVHEELRVQKTAAIAALQQALDKAVAGENFEEAARLRDRIAACRAQVSATPDQAAAPRRGATPGKDDL
jgi:protein-arginine kinase activator protein McsA